MNTALGLLGLAALTVFVLWIARRIRPRQRR
jgi:hypothetical protein